MPTPATSPAFAFRISPPSSDDSLQVRSASVESVSETSEAGLPPVFGSNTQSNSDAMSKAVACLMTFPTSALASRELTRSYSAEHGSQWFVQELSHALDARDSLVGSKPNAFQLTGAYRYWGKPPTAPQGSRFSVSLASTPVGADGFRLGLIGLETAPRIVERFLPSGQSTTCAVRLHSEVGGFTSAGAWHSALFELAQDRYLVRLGEMVPMHESAAKAGGTSHWPTLTKHCLLRVEHGLGVPVREVDGRRTAVGFNDVVDEGLLAAEGYLFATWLQAQIAAGAESWTDRQLEQVLTPALAAWVKGARIDAQSGGHAMWSSLFDFIARNSTEVRLKDNVMKGVVLNLDCARMRSTDGQSAPLSLDDLKRSYPYLSAFVSGLARLQDLIRYGEFAETNLPVAGVERAYLNSLLRNLACVTLEINEPAEIAQFDLMLRACRRLNNSGYSDDAINLELTRHHESVANSQAGCQSDMRLALQNLTRAIETAADQQESDFPFSFDERSSSTASNLHRFVHA